MIGLVADFGVILLLSLTLAALLLAARLCIRYEITPNCLAITWLGFRVRSIRWGMIHSFSSRPVFWAENWSNVVLTKHRHLVIRLESGHFRNVLITPDKPYVFRSLLDKAKKDFQDITHGQGFKTEHLIFPGAQKPNPPTAPHQIAA
jgi:hypothetical protein